MTPKYSLIELLAQENLDAIRNRLLARFEGRGFPAVSEWRAKGGVEMSFVTMISQSIAELLAADIPEITAGGFLGKAKGIWLDLLAETVFLLKRVPATKTSFNMDLVVADAVSAAYTWDVGDVEIVAKSGNRYRNATAAKGEPGKFGTLRFEAEAEGSSYNDDPSLADDFALVTTFAGVTLRPPAPPFSTVFHLGASTGQIVPGGKAASQSYVVRIDAPGDPGTARYSIAANGGAFVSMGVLQRTNSAGFGGMTLAALPGSGSPLSFRAGDVFVFTAPGTPELIQGSDAETDEALAARCRGRWPSLSLNPTEGLFQLWALLAVPTASRIQVGADRPDDPSAVPGRVSMYVADSRGPMDPSALAQITAYITPKLSVLDGFIARQAVARKIAVSGSVLVTPDTLVAAQQAAEKAWTSYLGSVPIGGRVELARLEQILMDAGAVDVNGLEINGIDFDTYLRPGEVPVATASLIDSLDWLF
jgi:hypothetical protein